MIQVSISRGENPNCSEQTLFSILGVIVKYPTKNCKRICNFSKLLLSFKYERDKREREVSRDRRNDVERRRVSQNSEIPKITRMYLRRKTVRELYIFFSVEKKKKAKETR